MSEHTEAGKAFIARVVHELVPGVFEQRGRTWG